MTNARSVDDLAQLCVALALDEVNEIMAGEDHITPADLTACEMVALLTVLRPGWERKRLAQKQPAPVLKLVRSDTGQEPYDSTLRPSE
jgi:hypothetical protein